MLSSKPSLMNLIRTSFSSKVLVPFFEKYKYDPDSFPKVDYSSAGGDLLKEMQLDNEAIKDRTLGDGFERVPFDYYEQLQETLVDMIPDFRIRLKVDPRTREMVFAADVHSVFDICWFTLAKKLSVDVAPEEKGTSADVKLLTREWSCPAPSAKKPISEPPIVPSPAKNRNVTGHGKR